MDCIHHWHIDCLNLGTCQLCGQVKDFAFLLHGKHRHTIPTPQALAARKRWDNPEYQAKQAASKLLGWERRKRQEVIE